MPQDLSLFQKAIALTYDAFISSRTWPNEWALRTLQQMRVRRFPPDRKSCPGKSWARFCPFASRLSLLRSKLAPFLSRLRRRGGGLDWSGGRLGKVSARVAAMSRDKTVAVVFSARSGFVLRGGHCLCLSPSKSVAPSSPSICSELYQKSHPLSLSVASFRSINVASATFSLHASKKMLLRGPSSE